MRSQATRMLIISMVAIILLCGIGLFYVWRHHRVITMGSELAKVTEQYQELCKERDLLQAEYETLRRSPENLKRATEEFGMQPPDTERIITVPAGNRSGQEAK